MCLAYFVGCPGIEDLMIGLRRLGTVLETGDRKTGFGRRYRERSAGQLTEAAPKLPSLLAHLEDQTKIVHVVINSFAIDSLRSVDSAPELWGPRN